MRSIGIILLAAGGSTRMGRPKQLLPFEETTLVRHAAKTAVATGFSPVVVVLGAEMEACRRELDDLPVTIASHPEWSEGMGSSLRVGVEALEKILPGVEAVLVVLHDQALVSPQALQKLAELWNPPEHEIAAAFYDGTPGVPAVFSRSFFPELKALRGNSGAKKILLRHAAGMATLEMPEAMEDVDSPGDYERLSGKLKK